MFEGKQIRRRFSRSCGTCRSLSSVETATLHFHCKQAGNPRWKRALFCPKIKKLAVALRPLGPHGSEREDARETIIAEKSSDRRSTLAGLTPRFLITISRSVRYCLLSLADTFLRQDYPLFSSAVNARITAAQFLINAQLRQITGEVTSAQKFKFLRRNNNNVCIATFSFSCPTPGRGGERQLGMVHVSGPGHSGVGIPEVPGLRPNCNQHRKLVARRYFTP